MDSQIENNTNILNSVTPKTLPNSTTVLVLGILSLVTCFCYGLPGLIMGIIALVLASKGKKVYDANPSEYTEGSLKNLNAGKVCGLIGTILSGVYALFMIFYLMIVGAALTSIFSAMPWENL